jgi:DNA-binding transcriptional LysR family regulator
VGSIALGARKRGLRPLMRVRQAVRDIEFLSDPATGEIKIGCPGGIAAILLPIVEGFSRRYPSVAFDVREEEIETLDSKLRNRELDFVVQRLRSYPLADVSFDDFALETLFDDELVIVAGRSSPWAKRREILLSQLTDESWVLSGPPSWPHRIMSEAFAAQELGMPKIILKTYSVHIRANLVASGRFIATLPKSGARFYADRFSLKVLPIDLPVRPWPVVILTLKTEG